MEIKLQQMITKRIGFKWLGEYCNLIGAVNIPVTSLGCSLTTLQGRHPGPFLAVEWSTWIDLILVLDQNTLPLLSSQSS